MKTEEEKLKELDDALHPYGDALAALDETEKLKHVVGLRKLVEANIALKARVKELEDQVVVIGSAPIQMHAVSEYVPGTPLDEQAIFVEPSLIALPELNARGAGVRPTRHLIIFEACNITQYRDFDPRRRHQLQIIELDED